MKAFESLARQFAALAFLTAVAVADPVATDQPAAEASPKQSRLAAAFEEGDIDWENTAEFPSNDDVKGFAKSREDQILRCIGLRSPGAAHGKWTAGEAAGGSAYCRLAFKDPVTIGTVVIGSAAPAWEKKFRTFSGAGVSVLKLSAPFPGDVEDEDQWEPVEAVQQAGAAVIFTMPPRTKVRAVRLTSPVEAARFFRGRLVAVEAAGQLTDGRLGTPLLDGGGWFVKLTEPISPENPQQLIYEWDSPRMIQGIMLLQPSFAECRVEIYKGPAGRATTSTDESDWKTVAERTYASPWRGIQQDVVELERETKTTAVRVLVTKPWLSPNDDVKHWFGGEGHGCGLTGLVVLEDR